MIKVAGIGNALIDVFVDGTDAKIAEAGLTKGGTHIVSLKEWAEYAKQFPMIFLSPGGETCNTFSTLALLGMQCQMFASIGKDDFGATLKDHFSGLGINTENVHTMDKKATGRALVIVTPDQVRTHVIHLGACQELSGQHVSMHSMLDSKALVLEGFTVANDSTREAVARGVEISHIQDIISVLTLSGSQLVTTHREHFNKYLAKNVNVVFGKVSEFNALFDTSSVEESVSACKDRENLSIITQGAEGAVLCQKGQVIEIPPVQAKKIIDNTGAGDQFLAGFLTAYLKGASLAPAGRFGSVLGSAIIEQISGIFHRDIKDIVARAT